jgi:Flp pilus assembly protein TadD
MLARHAVDGAREDGSTLLEAWTLPSLGCALARQQGRVEAAEAFERAVKLSRAMPEPFNEAIARHDWACMLAEAGDVSGAREQLDGALRLFRELGARPFVERSERLLASLQTAGKPA